MVMKVKWTNKIVFYNRKKNHWHLYSLKLEKCVSGLILQTFKNTLSSNISRHHFYNSNKHCKKKKFQLKLTKAPSLTVPAPLEVTNLDSINHCRNWNHNLIIHVYKLCTISLFKFKNWHVYAYCKLCEMTDYTEHQSVFWF